MNELKGGIEEAFAVFPEPAAFFEPGEGAFDDPALGDDREGVKLAAFGDLHGSAKQVIDGLGKRFACISGVCEQGAHLAEVLRIEAECNQRTFSVGHLRGRHGKGMRQSLRVHRDMPLDPRHFLARIVTFLFGRVRVFDALRINDQIRRLFFPSRFFADLSNLIFLMPAPAGLAGPFPVFLSTWQNTHTPSSTSDTPSAAASIGIPSSAHTAARRTPHTNPPLWAASASSLPPTTPPPS